MATKYGQYSSDRLEDVPSAKVPANAEHGRMRVAFDTYTFTADLSASDVIKMGKLPAGARVVGYWLSFESLDASGGTVDFGWAASEDGVEAADDNGFFDNADVTSAATINETDAANLAGLGKVFSSPVDLEIKIEGDTDTTSGTIKSCVFYVVD